MKAYRTKTFGISAFIALIIFALLPAGCGDGGGDKPVAGGLSPSLNRLVKWLQEQPANTALTPYTAVLNIKDKDLPLNENGRNSDLYYALKNGGRYVILDLSGSAITSIPGEVFDPGRQTNPWLTGIIIPESVMSIGGYAFSRCAGLTSVIIPDSVTSIGTSAFSGCTGLASVTIGNGVTSIGNGAFIDCSSLTSVAIPDSVTSSIGYATFYNCTSLKSVTIGNGVTSIDSRSGYLGAFEGCAGLESVTIGDGVTSIGERAFLNCTGLASFTVSGNNPNYSSQDGILYNKAKTRFELIPSAIGHIAIPDSITDIGTAFRGHTSLASVTIGNGVTSIGNYAFEGCASLESVTIGDSVTSIGGEAFFGCTGLTEINFNAAALADVAIPDAWNKGVFSLAGQSKPGITVNIGAGVTKIPAYLFNTGSGSSPKITAVNFAAGSVCSSIGGRAFSYCASLESVTIGDSVTSIGSGAFFSCTGLASITIPDSVTSIGGSAFYGCSGLTSVTIGNGVTSIGSSAFWYCASLASFTADGNNPSYASQDGVLYNKAKTVIELVPLGISGSITIPDGVTGIGGNAFSGCAGLKSVAIPNSVTSIGSGAFFGCAGLTSVTIPESVTSIGNMAFSGCAGLTEINFKAAALADLASSYSVFGNAGQSEPGITVNIGAGVTKIPANLFNTGSGSSPKITAVNFAAGSVCSSIGESAFKGCASLASVTIGSGVTSIGSTAFSGCTGLASITVGSGNTKYRSEGNCIIQISNNTLVLGCKTSVIPSSVTSIDSGAFRDCTGLTSVGIPSSVTSIGHSAFSGCTGLTSVIIPNSVTSIYDYAFDGCTSLARVTLGNNLSYFGSSAFLGNLRMLYYMVGVYGGAGTYTTAKPGANASWVKQ